MMNIPMHRFKYTKLTSDQIGQKLTANGGRAEMRIRIVGCSCRQVAQNRDGQWSCFELRLYKTKTS